MIISKCKKHSDVMGDFGCPACWFEERDRLQSDLAKANNQLVRLRNYPQLCPDCQKGIKGGECLGCQADKLQAENEQLKELHRWTPVEERLPEIGQEIIGYFPNFVGSKFCITIWWKEALAELDNITHWKPIILPTKP